MTSLANLFRKNPKIWHAVLLAVGFFVFSDVPVWIFRIVGGIPSLYEVMIFPIGAVLLLLKCEILRAPRPELISKDGRTNIWFIVFAGLFVVLGAIAYFRHGMAYEVAKTARSYWAALLIFYYRRQLRAFDFHDLYWVCVGSVIGGIVYTYIGFQYTIQPDGSVIETLFNAPVVPLFVVTLYPFLNQGARILPIALFSAALASLALVHSSFRINLLCVAAAITLGSVYVAVVRRSLSAILGAAVTIPVILGAGFGVLQYIEASADLRQYNRLVERTQLFFSDAYDSGDIYRVYQIQETFQLATEQIVPGGYIIRNSTLTGRGIYKDVPLYELIYGFGSLLAVIIVGTFVFLGCRRLFETVRHGLSGTEALAGLLFPFLFLLLFLNGDYFVIPYENALTFLLVSRWFLPPVQPVRAPLPQHRRHPQSAMPGWPQPRMAHGHGRGGRT